MFAVMGQQRIYIIVFLIVLVGVAAFGFAGKFMNNSEPTVDNTVPTATPAPTGYDLSNPPSGAPAPQIKQYPKFPGEMSSDKLKNQKAVITTKKGVIEFEIYPEATKAASNFIFLANDHFYDSLTFHRVEPGFVIQGGDPVGNGTGGPGYKFEDEPVKRKYDQGIVAMANSGPNTNGSQFFIMLEDNPLPPNYTIFGKVIKGQDVVSKIQPGDVMETVVITPN